MSICRIKSVKAYRSVGETAELERVLAGQVERLRREDGAVGRAALLKERRRIANDRPRKIGRDVSHCSERNKVSNPATRCNSNDSGGGSKPKDAQSTESTGCSG